MTKILLLVSLCTILSSCNKDTGQTNCPTNSTTTKPALVSTEPAVGSSSACPADDGTSTPGDGTVVDTPPVTPSEPGSDVPHEALIFDANISFTNFDKSEQAKVDKAIEIIKKVVASSEFRNRVLNFTYNGKKQFVDNNGLTNAQIYQSLLDASEELLPGKDHQMDLELELYYSWTSTVGYTYPDDLRIYMNTKFFDSYTPAEVADNVFHEWTHKLGYDHDSSYSVSRDSSVPYALGYLIEELGRKYE